MRLLFGGFAVALLTEVADLAGNDQLVLCCFEDLRTPGAWCHRRIFATWWEQATGEPVLELSEG